MVTYERAVEVADTYMQAMSAQDWAAVMELYAEDATLEDPVGSEIKIGKPAVTDFYFGIGETNITCTRTGAVRFANAEMVFPFECVMRSDDGAMKIDIIDHFILNDAGLITQMRAFWGPETAGPYEES
jgi:steroid delta-isomerase